jgi:iron(III) transport system substrate-binding protein
MPRLSRLVLIVALLGCGGPDADVVLYVSLDRNHSEPIVKAFEAKTGLKVNANYDVEATKSVGLRRRIQTEANNPRCDVFWNNEVVQTVLLAEQGLLQPYDSPNAADVPDNLKSPDHLWTGFAARGRVLIVNTEAMPDEDNRPTGMSSFVAPEWADRAGMARPLTGTTAAHAGVLISREGLPNFLGLLEDMRDNQVHFGPGNAHLMRLVRDGELDFGWTDTDDYRVAEEGGFPVAMVVPDQAPGEIGLIVIPNTVGMVTGARHPKAAQQLIDFILSHEVEQLLAAGQSAQIPLRPDVERPDHVLNLSRWKVAEVDWRAAGEAYSKAADDLEAFFTR